MEKVDKLIKLAIKDAEEKEYISAQAGGSLNLMTELVDNIRFFRMGQNNEIPNEWLKYEHQLDEEYDEYLRLKNKFEA